MIVQQILFYVFSILIIFSALFLLFTKNIVHAAFSFLTVLLGVSIFFVYLNAEFIAVSQIMIYVGGVLVLLIFGVMLTNASALKENATLGLKNIAFYFFCLFFGGLLVYSFPDIQLVGTEIADQNLTTQNFSLPQKTGYFLITDYIVAFEASGILLMIALIGAATIAGRK